MKKKSKYKKDVHLQSVLKMKLVKAQRARYDPQITEFFHSLDLWILL